ncbi:MAG: sulfite exporter TauE/SafE family protein [Planctomycetota bacterium]
MNLAAIDWLPTPPPGTPGWLYIGALSLAVVVIGIAKSGFGGGVGIVAVPLVMVALPPGRALGVMLPILIVADALAVVQHRRHRSWPHLRPALIGGAIGIVLGTAALLTLVAMDRSGGRQDLVQDVLRFFVGAVCMVLVGLQVYRLTGRKVPPLPGNKPTGITVGGLAGFTSTLAHAAGPIMSVYWLEQRMSKQVLTGSLVLFFVIVNAGKLPSYLMLGWISPTTLIESALFALAVPVGSLLGIAMHHRIPEKPFMAVMYVGAAVAGLWLMVRSAL